MPGLRSTTHIVNHTTNKVSEWRVLWVCVNIDSGILAYYTVCTVDCLLKEGSMQCTSVFLSITKTVKKSVYLIKITEVKKLKTNKNGKNN